MSVTRPFGLEPGMDSAYDIASAAIRRSPALARAYRKAARIVCDGWPVQIYARFCGLRVARVTGCEITAALMRMAPAAISHRFFFVVDGAETESAVNAWTERHGVASATTIPPFGFERDAGYCERLAQSVRSHGTTVLIMVVGAPRSEVFVDTYRWLLPPCRAFCVGQAVKIELGLVRRASSKWQSAGMEWLWRMLQEPSRLTKRYVTGAAGFGLAVIADRLRNRREGRS